MWINLNLLLQRYFVIKRVTTFLKTNLFHLVIHLCIEKPATLSQITISNAAECIGVTINTFYTKIGFICLEQLKCLKNWNQWVMLVLKQNRTN